MPLFQIALVALIQGITEFLPVSSSGHLILLPALTGLDDQGQAIDVAVHVGTLGAVILFFRGDAAALWRGTLDLAAGRHGPDRTLALLMAVATVPVLVFGLALKLTGADMLLRSAHVIGVTMIVFGVALWWADRTGGTRREAADWSMRDAVVMGLWQAIALVPGTSRSGATITAARLRGFERRDGARLAMLMSIPTILAAGALTGAEVAGELDAPLLRDMGLAALLAFAAALAALGLMMRLLRSVSFTPYVVYRIALGALILIWVQA